MKLSFYVWASILLVLASCSGNTTSHTTSLQTDSIIRIEMQLSAFGVESDDFPSIDATLDFVKNTSLCKKSYYSPAHSPSEYSLTKADMQRILKLLTIKDPARLKDSYKVAKTDQPTSTTTTIYTRENTYKVEDYGLQGEHPLPELYAIVYKLGDE